MSVRLGIIDPYDGDRDPGEWSVQASFIWFRAGLGAAGFRGFTLVLFRWQFLLGQEVEF